MENKRFIIKIWVGGNHSMPGCSKGACPQGVPTFNPCACVRAAGLRATLTRRSQPSVPESTDNCNVNFTVYKGDYYVSTETHRMRKVDLETLDSEKVRGMLLWN